MQLIVVISPVLLLYCSIALLPVLFSSSVGVYSHISGPLLIYFFLQKRADFLHKFPPNSKSHYILSLHCQPPLAFTVTF